MSCAARGSSDSVDASILWTSMRRCRLARKADLEGACLLADVLFSISWYSFVRRISSLVRPAAATSEDAAPALLLLLLELPPVDIYGSTVPDLYGMDMYGCALRNTDTAC